MTSTLTTDPHDIKDFLRDDGHDRDSDGDTASQRSISLSSPAVSQRNSLREQKLGKTGKEVEDLLRELNLGSSATSNSVTTLKDSSNERPKTFDSSDFSEADDAASIYTGGGPSVLEESPNTSASPSVLDHDSELKPTYPPIAHRSDTDSRSIASTYSTSSGKKARPESVLIGTGSGKLVLGIALVDFNHLVGPKIEWSKGEVFEDPEVARMLPFLALPDGAHLSSEDYSYFHIVPSSQPNPTTIFGISCNQQIAASALLVKMPDVTRSIVQKAVVVLASKPVFGPIRDKLGVVTTALFQQRDFSSTEILDEFESGLEASLRGQLTESGLYMGTSLRDFVHAFRHRTLVILKALILQKRIIFTSHPVERLCTYQYSLLSLIPGLLQSLEDCGSPPLAERQKTLEKPTELRTSDPKSMRRYIGLPLDLFGKDAFFQPYLPLQQLDLLRSTPSWLCGSTNSIVNSRSDCDMIVNIEEASLEFRNPNLERMVSLTPADRKWMDGIVRDVNESIESNLGGFKGSDDYLRTKFEEYISAALASVRYRDFLAKNEARVMILARTGAEASSAEDFNPLWIQEFKTTNAYEVWDRTTDQALFDIIEPRHPTPAPPTIVSDIGIRLSEGIQDLKLDQQLAPAREAISAGATGLFNAVAGMRERWSRPAPTPANTMAPTAPAGDSPPIEVLSKAELESAPAESQPATSPLAGFVRPNLWGPRRESTASTTSTGSGSGSNTSPTPNTPTTSDNQSPPATARQSLSSWGSGIGSFVSSRVGRFSLSRNSTSAPSATSPSESIESLPSVGEFGEAGSVAKKPWEHEMEKDKGVSSTRNSTISISSGSDLHTRIRSDDSEGGDSLEARVQVIASPTAISPSSSTSSWAAAESKQGSIEGGRKSLDEEPKTPGPAPSSSPNLLATPTSKNPGASTHARTHSEAEEAESAYAGVAM
ncbi:cytoplasmic protein [Moniliophthora roreri MCA 2997]|uniref:Cytoplasmic protein n=1 Tax=Moniliophthora roreri (strain MCA 2997) TaxID=1381753 RepID=V2YFR5_MONRO|nr:cytoplasmic protein [Moniliophthora roreri MCA 2997]